MSRAVTTVEQWKALNSHKLLKCRWGCKLTTQACRSYQSRTPRYVIHFNGSLEPCSRVNADYINCLLPEPCPHLVSDCELREADSRTAPQINDPALRRKGMLHRGREMERLSNPDRMLQEAEWHRSLVKG